MVNLPPRECICQICTCGRHHCPHKPKHRPTGPCALSEYTNRYRQFPILMRSSFKPKPELRPSDAPMEDKTSNRIDYVAHKLEKPFMKDQAVYKKPDQEMDMQTSYNQNYTGKTGPPTMAIRNECQKKVSGKFDGQPTYTADYRKWDIDRRKGYGPELCWAPPDIKMEGLSTQRNDYPGYIEPVRDSMRPPHKSLASGEPLDDVTDYRQSYVRHPMPPKFIRDQATYKGPIVPLDALTTFRRDYLGKQGQKVTSCKPDHRRVGSDAPMEDITTVRADYREWPHSRPKPHVQPSYLKPEGDMESATTYRTTYRPNKSDRTMAYKPVAARRLGGPFDGTTNYMTEYRKWDGLRPPKAMMKPQLAVSDAPFDGISTQRAHYIGYPEARPTESCRPLHRGVGSDAPLEDSTMYRTEYTPKARDPCPVPTINMPASKYIYYGDDERGHKFYDHKVTLAYQEKLQNAKPLSMSATALPEEITAPAAALPREVTVA